MSTKLILVKDRAAPRTTRWRGHASPHSLRLQGQALGESKAIVTPASRSKACWIS
jgi:hypothetical protein